VTPHDPHISVGAYLLGALDDDEMTAFEEHLAECARCGLELDELSGVVPVLDVLRSDGIGYVEPPSGDALLGRLLAEVAGERRRHRTRRLVAVAVAAVLVVGGPTIAVLAAHDDHPRQKVTALPADPVERFSGSDPATGVSAVADVSDKGWGSSVGLRLTGVQGPLICHLDAVGRNGARQTVATWSVPPSGYGTRAQPVPLVVDGATGMHGDEISRFEVKAQDGSLLVALPRPEAQPSDRPRTS